MKKFSFTPLLILYFALSPNEFWLEPDKFIYDRGDEINISFLTGKNFEGENWNGDSLRISSLVYYYGGVKDDIPKKLFPGKGDTLHLRQYDEGTNMLTYNSFNIFTNWEVISQFDEYLTEYGLDNAIEYRKQANKIDSVEKEFFQYSVKTIFQVGNVKDETYKQPTSLPLDIIPQSHPYKHSDGDVIGFRIFFKGDAFANSLVKVWHYNKGETTRTELKTDENGAVKIPVKNKGRWMISAVKMERVEESKTVPWQSYWGSCTWGYY